MPDSWYMSSCGLATKSGGSKHVVVAGGRLGLAPLINNVYIYDVGHGSWKRGRKLHGYGHCGEGG